MADLHLKLLHTCLDALEQEESVLLAWGDCGGYFRREDILERLEKIVPGEDPEEIMEAMCSHAMLLQVPVPGHPGRYRTRMGQAIHLFRNLRQWMRYQPLEASRTLVSDYRFMRRPRKYPAWDLDPLEQIQGWETRLGLQPEFRKAILSLLGDGTASSKLAGFQARATERILAAWKHHAGNPNRQTGTIVCAGTGSGKTLSFYLPALASLAADLCSNSQARVRVLAIYPRKELLKDQFTEAYRQCRRLDAFLGENHTRKIRIGALFGDTPRNGVDAQGTMQRRHWSEFRYGTLRCPGKDCKGEMVWPEAQRSTGTEGLQCRVCSRRIESDEVALTREVMAVTPPDILFTTTEMLNQNLGNFDLNRLFGVGAGQGPTLVLLDEVHTYGGTSGAQTALLLRRWMRRSGCRPHFVGLSATLADAGVFFSDLISTRIGQVEHVEPSDQEMKEEGAEYVLVLRGDPVSQTALQSTTIQATMLLERLMDDERHQSRNTWGAKTFVFADDLDVVNRLYGQIADAEGYALNRGRLDPRLAPLASLRFQSPQTGTTPQSPIPTPGLKLRLGQDWSAVQDIRPGFRSTDRLRLGRTSSQDSGVDSRAEVIIATASLEVGFNDPEVGAVLQHKAPRDVAAYLQRKGRAGRLRGMRPWMVVVLSEFGRDRVAFQRYEELQSPVVKRQRLPLKNTHLLKMQGAMVVLDWLSLKLGRASIWLILNKPRGRNSELDQLRTLLDRVLLAGTPERQDFMDHLKGALEVSQEVLDLILWSPPRSLMLECIPTLQRLITTRWSEDGVEWAAMPNRWGSPLPEFIPSNLFSELNVPEVTIDLPGPTRDASAETLSFFQAMREFAPGRISKRFAIDNAADAFWLVPQGFQPSPGTSLSFEFEIIDGFGKSLYLETEVEKEEGGSLPVFRPIILKPQPPAPSLRLTEKSNAQHSWNTRFRPSCEAQTLEPPRGPWEGFLRGVTFCLHQDMAPLELVRYSTSSNATLRFTKGDPCQVDFQWHHQNEPAAIGSRMWVDGIRLSFSISQTILAAWCEKAEVARALRPALFRHMISLEPAFKTDPFKAEWVAECYLAALADRMAAKGPEQPLSEAINWLTTQEGRTALESVPLTLFQRDDTNPGQPEQRLQVELKDWLAEDESVQALTRCAGALTGTLGKDSGKLEWSRQVLGNTLAAAAQQALFQLLPDVDDRSVMADALWEEDNLHIWISESEPGGSGILAQWAEAYLHDPVRVLNLFASTLNPSDYEQIDHDLFAALELAVEGDAPLRVPFSALRSADGASGRREATRQAHRALRDRGFALSGSFLAVLHSRILWQGSSSESDSELLGWLRRWRTFEEGTHLEWPLSLMAHVISREAAEESQSQDHRFRRACLVLGRLWARGNQIRKSELAYYSPFLNGALHTERLLGAQLVMDHTPKIAVSSQDWFRDLIEALRTRGQARLLVPWNAAGLLPEVILKVQVTPMDYLGMLVYPRLAGVKRWQEDFVLGIELAEMVH